jgi:hypothetical protein
MQPEAVPAVDERRLAPIGPIRRSVREVGFALITAGVVIFLFVAYQLWGTGFAERSSQSKLRKEFDAQLATPPPTTSTTRASSPVATPTATARPSPNCGRDPVTTPRPRCPGSPATWPSPATAPPTAHRSTG